MRRNMLMRAAGGAAAALVAAFTMWVPPANAISVPYTDLAVTGSVGLCNSAGQPVTHGRIDDKPFVHRAVSSVAAPPPYNGTGRKATLVAYQPRQGANPNLWSGDTLTSSSTYTNPRYPMAQATSVDFSLRDFLKEYAPIWDGFVELRMYVSAPKQGTFTDSYSATDIHVTGSTWTVVRGASVPCTLGSAKDGETKYIPPATSKPSGGETTGSAHNSTSPTSSGSSSSTPSNSGSTSPAASTTAQTSAAAATKKNSSSTTPIFIALVAVVAVAGLGAGYAWRRRNTG